MQATVELLGSVGNCHVVQVSGRSFPAIVIQGDTLHTMFSLCRDALQAVERGAVEDGADHLVSLLDEIREKASVYETVLAERSIGLPYAGRVSEDH